METIAICRSGSGTDLLHQPEIRLVASVCEGSKRVLRLRVQNHVLLRFHSADPVPFEIGDWIAYQGERFYLTATPVPTLDAETGAYSYALEFQAEERLWANKLHKLNPDSLPELNFKLTSSLEAHARVILRALAHHRLHHYSHSSLPSFPTSGTQPVQREAVSGSAGVFSNVPYSFAVDDCIAETAAEGRLIEYAGVSILEALDMIADAWECEWWREGAVIRFGHCENGDDLLRLERDLNISEIRPSGADGAVPNRLYPFGGTENIPPYYRKNLRLLVESSDSATGRFWVDRRELALTMFNPGKANHKEGYCAAVTMSAVTKTKNFQANERTVVYDVDDYANLKKGDYTVSLSRFKPNVCFLQDGVPVTDLTGTLEYVFSVEFQVDGDYGKTTVVRNPEPVLHAGSGLRQGDGPEWKDWIFRLEEDVECVFRFKITWKPTENSKDYELSFRHPHPAVKVECISDGPSYGPLTVKKVQDGREATVLFNPDHYTGEGLAFLHLEGEPIIKGDIITFANPAADLRRLSIPASWYLPEDGNANVDAIADNRLRIPEADADGKPRPPCIDAYGGITDATAVEHAEYFDNVFPQQSCTVGAVASRLVEQTESDGGVTRHYVWYVTLTEQDTAGDASPKPFVYDPDARLTEDLRIKFTSGLLNGMTFTVGWHPEGTAETSSIPCFEIGVTADYGPELPNAVHAPCPGDTAILLGWADESLIDRIIDQAEAELLDRATEWLERRLTDGQTFDCPWLGVQDDTAFLPPVGRRVALVAPDLFPRGEFRTRVLGYEYPLDIPEDHPVITVGDLLPKSRLAGIETALRKGSATQGTAPATASSKTLSGKILVADLTNQADAIVFDALGRIVGPLPSTAVLAYADGAEVPAEISLGDSWNPARRCGLSFAIDGQRLDVTGADLSMPEFIEVPVRVRIPGYLDINLAPFDRILTFTIRRQRGDARLQLQISPTVIHLPSVTTEAGQEPDSESGIQPTSPVNTTVVLISASGSETLTDAQLEDAGLAIEWASSDQPEFGPDIPPVNEAVGDGPATGSLTVRLVRYPDDGEDPEILDIETIPVLQDGKDGEIPYLVEAYTLTGDKIKNSQGATQLRARVLRGTDVLEDAESLIYDYVWEKYDTSGARVNWKSTGTPTRTGNPLTVSAAEVDLRATFRVLVYPKPA